MLFILETQYEVEPVVAVSGVGAIVEPVPPVSDSYHNKPVPPVDAVNAEAVSPNKYSTCVDAVGTITLSTTTFTATLLERGSSLSL